MLDFIILCYCTKPSGCLASPRMILGPDLSNIKWGQATRNILEEKKKKKKNIFSKTHPTTKIGSLAKYY